jgi:hypothetical protein
MSVLFYTNASGDGTWETLTNWNAAADGSGSNPTEIPWSDTDGSTSASNLNDATGGVGVTINSTTIDPNGDVTGSCDISNVTCNYWIEGGTWTGDNFNNIATISGGMFTGDNFTNTDTINGGTFTGGNVTNNGWIGGGTFTADNFTNNDIVGGGTFTGDYFNSTWDSTIFGGTFLGGYLTCSGPIYGGTFEGNYYTFDQAYYGWTMGGLFSGNYYTNNCPIVGGTWTGDYLTNTNTIYGGTFTGDNFTNSSGGSIEGGTFTGNDVTNDVGGWIYGGTFTGDNFYNINYINGGSFQYSVFNNTGWIYDANLYIGILLGDGYIDPSVTIVYFARTDPTITPDQNYNLIYNNNLTITIAPSSNSSGQLHFTLQQQPSGVVINGLTGIITTTPNVPDTGTFEVYVTQDSYENYNAVTTPVLVSTVTINPAVPTITPSGDQNELFYTGMTSIPLLQPAQSNPALGLVYSFEPPVESGWSINPTNGTIIAGNPLASTSWSVSIGVTQAASSDGNYAAITTPVIVSTVTFTTLDGLPASVAIPPSGWRYCNNGVVIVAESQQELYEAVIEYLQAHGQPVNLGVIDDINAFLKTGLPQLLKSRSCWQSWPECC